MDSRSHFATSTSNDTAPAAADYTVRVLHTVSECEPWQAQWLALWQQCTNANPYFHPDILLPAWRELEDDGVSLYLIFAAQKLVAVLPTQTTARFRGAPARWLRAWGHLHCFSDEPLILAGHETPVLKSVFQQWRESGIHGASWFKLPGDSPSAQTLTAARQHDTRQILRASLAPHDADYQPIDQRLSKKKRKEYGRLWRRFEELGVLKFDAHRCQPDDHAITAFMTIEQSGWKGAQGTSLLSNPNERRFSEQMFANAARDGLLYLYQLTLNDKPVASLTAFRGGDHLYLFKIGFDESYSRFSPGVLLMLEATRLWEQQTFTLIDSCAQPGHPMIDHLWYQRRTILRLHADSGRGYGKLLLFFSGLISRWQARREQR